MGSPATSMKPASSGIEHPLFMMARGFAEKTGFINQESIQNIERMREFAHRYFTEQQLLPFAAFFAPISYNYERIFGKADPLVARNIEMVVPTVEIQDIRFKKFIQILEKYLVEKNDRPRLVIQLRKMAKDLEYKENRNLMFAPSLEVLLATISHIETLKEEPSFDVKVTFYTALGAVANNAIHHGYYFELDPVLDPTFLRWQFDHQEIKGIEIYDVQKVGLSKGTPPPMPALYLKDFREGKKQLGDIRVTPGLFASLVNQKQVEEVVGKYPSWRGRYDQEGEFRGQINHDPTALWIFNEGARINGEKSRVDQIGILRLSATFHELEHHWRHLRSLHSVPEESATNAGILFSESTYEALFLNFINCIEWKNNQFQWKQEEQKQDVYTLAVQELLLDLMRQYSVERRVPFSLQKLDWVKDLFETIQFSQDSNLVNIVLRKKLAEVYKEKFKRDPRIILPYRISQTIFSGKPVDPS